MNSGLLIYKSYAGQFNIGDYIQSLAARQFFQSHIDVFLNREMLDAPLDQNVKVIMNGWFTHEPQHWPPSDKIIPLFVAFHINSVARDEMTSPQSIEYLKRHEPIGCRDWNTVDLLNDKGVEAFFTGCMTLTLGETYSSSARGEDVYFVDPYYDFDKSIPVLSNCLQEIILNLPKTRQLCLRMFHEITIKKLLRAAAFYHSYKQMFDDSLLLNANYRMHDQAEKNFKNEAEKFEYAEKLLRLYSRAKYVVTSRIHCALPCLGLNTPVLYVEHQQQSETSLCRLRGLRELFHRIEYSKGKLLWNNEIATNNRKLGKEFSFTNKADYIPLKNKLVSLCKRFTES